MRGTNEVDGEFTDIKNAADLATSVENPWSLFFSRKYRPQLFLCSFSTIAQQWTGQLLLSSVLDLLHSNAMHCIHLCKASFTRPQACGRCSEYDMGVQAEAHIYDVRLNDPII